MSKGEREGVIKVHVFLVWAIRWPLVSFSETDMGIGLVRKIRICFKHILCMCP